MSRPKNPFPSVFTGTLWPDSRFPVPVQAEYEHGWYQFHRTDRHYIRVLASGRRWKDVMNYINWGILVIDEPETEMTDISLADIL